MTVVSAVRDGQGSGSDANLPRTQRHGFNSRPPRHAATAGIRWVGSLFLDARTGAPSAASERIVAMAPRRNPHPQRASR